MNAKLKKLNKYMLETRTINGNWLAFNLLNFNYIITDEPFSKVNFEQLDEDTIDYLISSGFLSEKNEIEQVEYRLKLWGEHLENKFKEFNKDTGILLFITSGCNFRCSYCYQPDLFQHESRKEYEYMSVELLRNFFNYLDELELYNKTKITLYICGGEVFLDYQKSYEFIENLVEEAMKRNIMLNFITNGYLVDKYLDLLQKHDNIIFNITLEGVKEIHDKKRFLANGKATFEKIVDNVKKILSQTNHKVLLRCNLDDESINSLPKYLDFLKESNWINSSRVILAFRTVVDYEHQEGCKYPSVRRKLSIENGLLALEQIKNYNVKNFLIDEGYTLSPLFNLFWSRISGNGSNNKDNPMFDSQVGNIKLRCSENMGVIGSLDYKGDTRLCGYELSPITGSFIPEVNIDENLLKQRNSVEHLLVKLRTEPCVKCKYLFLCNRRMCSLIEKFKTYDETLEMCPDIENIAQSFFTKFGDIIL